MAAVSSITLDTTSATAMVLSPPDPLSGSVSLSPSMSPVFAALWGGTALLPHCTGGTVIDAGDACPLEGKNGASPVENAVDLKRSTGSKRSSRCTRTCFVVPDVEATFPRTTAVAGLARFLFEDMFPNKRSGVFATEAAAAALLGGEDLSPVPARELGFVPLDAMVRTLLLACPGVIFPRSVLLRSIPGLDCAIPLLLGTDLSCGPPRVPGLLRIGVRSLLTGPDPPPASAPASFLARPMEETAGIRRVPRGLSPAGEGPSPPFRPPCPSRRASGATFAFSLCSRNIASIEAATALSARRKAPRPISTTFPENGRESATRSRECLKATARPSLSLRTRSAKSAFGVRSILVSAGHADARRVAAHSTPPGPKRQPAISRLASSRQRQRDSTRGRKPSAVMVLKDKSRSCSAFAHLSSEKSFPSALAPT